MTALDFLKIYLQIQILFALGLISFRALRAALTAVRIRVSYRTLTRTAQMLLLVSALMPVALALLPEQALPRLQFQTFRPASEASPKVARKTRPPPILELTAPPPVTARPDETGSLRLWSLFKKGAADNAGTLCLLWLVGVLALMGRLLRELLFLRGLVRDGLEIRRSGRVSILVSGKIISPFATRACGRAHVLLPTDLLGSVRDFQVALRHELQHHRNGDPLWSLLFEICLCFSYANPAVFLWKKEVTELQELACDETLIGRKRVSTHDYISCLVRVAEAALENRSGFVGTMGLAAGFRNPRNFKSFLRRRIEMFDEFEKSRQNKRAGVLVSAFGVLTIAVAAYGSHQALNPASPQKPNPGEARFEPRVQAIAQQALQKAVKAYGAKGGFVLVSDPATGRLLAAANVSRDPERDRKTWSLSYRMEPASVMKGLIVAAALERHAISTEESFDCGNGRYLYGRNLFHDWRPFGRLTAAETVARSSNICGIKIAQKLGTAGITRMLNEFGFGPHGTTEGFPEARPGQVPLPEQLTEPEYIALAATGYTLQASFQITPLEMLQAYSAIANGGRLMKPLPASSSETEAQAVRTVLSPETVQSLKTILVKAVQDGTGKPARSLRYSTAGKTATAYTPGVPEHESLGGERAIASFVGFAPVARPRVSVYVGIIDPTNSKDHNPHGSEHAAPVFRDVAEQVLEYLQVPPDLP